MYHNRYDVEQAINALKEMLNGGIIATTARQAQSVKAKAPEAWQSPQWQTEARAALELAQNSLWLADEGAPGRAECDRRGIREDVQIAWGMGYGMAWNIKAGRMMPALYIPYVNRHITAIQYRFLNIGKDDTSADRFGQMKGGKRFLCGLHLNMQEAEPGQLGTLFAVEAEINGMSIFQEIYGRYAADSISFGPQSNLSNPDVARMLAAIAKRYKRVIVWADEADIALKSLGNMPNTSHCMAIHSRIDNGVKLDANELLQRGELGDLVFKLIKRASGQ
jgi:hypothetical protein